MLEPTSKFEYVPYRYSVPQMGEDGSYWWYSDDPREDILSNDDPDIIDYVNEVHGEDIQRVRPFLLDELALSNAPYSKMHTACALETFTDQGSSQRHNLYLGHREENLSVDGKFRVVTAIEMALGKIASPEEKVTGVYLTGRDLPAGKLKRMMPIPTDYDHLAERFDCEWGPTFLLIPPDSYGWPAMQGLRWAWARRHAKAYAQHDRIVLSELDDDEEPELRDIHILDRLMTETRLTPRDAKFVVDFTESAIRNRWTAFFTGSASGRGEITPAITEDYDDMEFIVVAERPDDAESHIVDLAERHYGPLTKVPEVAYDTYGGKKIKGFFLYDQVGNKLIQLAVGKTMDEVCFRPDVIERNSGIWMNDCRQVQ